MAASLDTTSQLGSAFLGERAGICVSTVPVTRLGFRRKTVECKESRIGKQPIEVPSNRRPRYEGQGSFRRTCVTLSTRDRNQFLRSVRRLRHEGPIKCMDCLGL
ncbi:hypothetical protein HanRHA438_Chr15g0703191 [Helianthus annuus]|uniref:Uncharacterized protein n=1 Tax=Helianthus annuus TaxID=4232 RepID=A0A251S8R1_HELAN|nr:hypothetical protein HanXRQr2_Chr15g0690771 [Helianthus annuus]KAJ0451014.1 putative ribosomal protein L6 [Helianthus annuus]KAJ0455385.1 hypothetical protein HanIR_Chr15g0750611 [Helianthus annuus]KAJ0472875.1 putative ribosomal protein L6 [Helianthus annuus]KAJ0648478.1 putative ribosomal protein L6 [Helianthus annuus]